MSVETDAVERQNRRIMDRLSYVGIYIGGCVVICLITLVAVATIALIRPESGSIISMIIGLTTPLMMGLLAAGLRDVHKGIDGRVSQLMLSNAAKAERDARADTIRELHQKLLTLTPGTPEYQAIFEQASTEALKHFNIVERRANP